MITPNDIDHAVLANGPICWACQREADLLYYDETRMDDTLICPECQEASK